MLSKNVLIPLITPINEDNQVCEYSVKALIDRSKEFVEGYIPCLTSGEGWKLSEEQWCDMVRYTIKHAPHHNVITGIEKPTTLEVMHFAKLANTLGADGIIITSPFGESVSQEEIYLHYQSLHDLFPRDLYIYNESELSNNKTTPETLIKISELSNVVGIKESSNSDEFNAIRALLQANGLKVYQGWENRIVDDELADGNICSLSNLYPKLCLQATQSESPKVKSELKSEINTLCERHQLFAEDWYAYIKQFLNKAGVISSSSCIEPA